jgi:hypothetical protein
MQRSGLGGTHLKELHPMAGKIAAVCRALHMGASLFAQGAYKRPEIHAETHGSDQ